MLPGWGVGIPADLVLLQELELDGDVAAQPLVLLLVDLVLLLGGVDPGQHCSVPRAHVQLLQVGAVRVELQPSAGGRRGRAVIAVDTPVTDVLSNTRTIIKDNAVKHYSLQSLSTAV